MAEIVADADRLLELARQAWVEMPEDSAQRQSMVDGAELLGQLLLQDIERRSGDGDGDADDGVSVRDGVSKDRMLSVHDPEMRHGHKSSRRRFNGHKAAIVVDTDSQLITAVDVLPGNAPDNLGALELVEQSEAITGLPVRRGGMSGMPAAVPVHRGQRQGRGRRVLIHPQEALLQEARALQQSDAYDEYRARRVVVEHRLARLVQLGVRQSRYFGSVKTRFQLYMAATVANLTLVSGKIGLSGSTGGGGAGHCVVLNDVHAVVANAAANSGAVRLGQLWSVILLTTALLPQIPFPNQGFPARFLGYPLATFVN